MTANLMPLRQVIWHGETCDELECGHIVDRTPLHTALGPIPDERRCYKCYGNEPRDVPEESDR